MTETNTTLTEAIAKCNGIKARLEILRKMSEPKPTLRLESITRPGYWKELQSADALHDCPEGTVIVAPSGRSFLRTDKQHNPWASSYGTHRTSDDLWRSLITMPDFGRTFKYLAAN